MSWPTRQDYFSAVQNPATAFHDPELKAGQPKLTPLGLPWGFNGAFASVYQFRAAGKDWAVKCFLNEYADQQQRYSAISSYLNSARLPYAVGFEYQNPGIIIAGKWHPILKMEWIKGQRLEDYVKDNRQKPRVLLDLAEKWLAMADALSQYSIAHGDLQHGNILILNGQIKLIDYDGMYVPAFQNKYSLELGHKNYQHPARKAEDFGPHIDHFSSWIIYLSLLALAEDPNLWEKIQDAGDDRLLFSLEDFSVTGLSTAFAELAKIQKKNISTVVSFIKSFLGVANLKEIPPLSVLSLDATASLASGAIASSEQWLRYQKYFASLPHNLAEIEQSQAAAQKARESDSQPVSSSPLTATIPLPGPTIHEKLCFYGVPLALLLVAIISGIGALYPLSSLLVALLTAAGGYLYLWNRFHRLPEYLRKRLILADIRALSAEVKAVELELEKISRQRMAVDVLEQEQLNSLPSRRAVCLTSEHEELSALADTLARERNALLKERQVLEMDEKRELAVYQEKIDQRKKSISVEIEAARKSLTAQLRNINDARQQTVADEFSDLQNESNKRKLAVLKPKLSLYKIANAGYSVLGPDTSILVKAGLHTAADLPDSLDQLLQIPGLTKPRCEKLMEWKRQVAEKFSQSVPSALTPAEEMAIHQKYNQVRQDLDQQTLAANENARHEEKKIHERSQQELLVLQQGLSECQRKHYKKKQSFPDRETELEQKAIREKNTIVSRWKMQRKQLDEEPKRIEREYQAQRRAVDDLLAPGQKKHAELIWKINQLNHELQTYDKITFARFSKGLISWQPI